MPSLPGSRGVAFLGGVWVILSITMAAASDRAYFFHSDHLGTPQAMTDQAGRTVWTVEYEPFGKVAVDQDPDGDGHHVVNNLRFPGQYYDAETGLHYNWHRDYDPEMGRYLQPDPLGLAGGLNPYPYAEGNPLRYSDPQGLMVLPWPVIVPAAEQALGALIGFIAGAAIADKLKDKCEEPCPPCKTVSGRIAPVGTIAYRPMDTPHPGVTEHGISGPHFNLYKANQAPRSSPKPCKCFWQPIGGVAPSHLPPGAIPIEPFAN
jgi:RHS repeat-associated protein